MVIGRSRGDYHQNWASKLLKQRIITIRRMSRVHGVEKSYRVIIRRVKKARTGSKKSRNARVVSQSMRETFGIKIPNSTKEALILDRINGDNKWHDSMQKELMALEKLNVWKFHPSHHRMPKDYQKAPLRMIFDIKKEDMRRKSGYVVGGHKIDSERLESYSSVVQSMSIRLLSIMADKLKLKVICGNVGNFSQIL